MPETKHTPGPWFAYGRYIGTKNHKSAVGECRDVNGNWSDDAKSSADARLIAAAPDLLEALKAMESEVSAIGMFAFDVKRLLGEEHWNHLLKALGDARQAISKAEPARQSATTVPQGGKSE